MITAAFVAAVFICSDSPLLADNSQLSDLGLLGVLSVSYNPKQTLNNE